MIIYENMILKVMFYHQLKVVNEHQIVITMKNYTLIIKGNGLFIHFFEKTEMHIAGEIEEVDFSYD